MFPTTGTSRSILLHEEQHLMELPRIISELGHDERRPGGDLLLQLEILGHLLRFGRLEGRDGHAGEKIARLMLDGPFEARDIPAPGSSAVTRSTAVTGSRSKTGLGLP